MQNIQGGRKLQINCFLLNMKGEKIIINGYAYICTKIQENLDGLFIYTDTGGKIPIIYKDILFIIESLNGKEISIFNNDGLLTIEK